MTEKLDVLETKIEFIERDQTRLLNELSETKRLASSAQKSLSKLMWVGATSAAALTAFFAYSWIKIPAVAVTKVEEKAINSVNSYIESGDILKQVASKLELQDGSLQLQAGTIQPEEWVEHGNGAKANVRLDLSIFENPKIFTSLKGLGGNWAAAGPSVYPIDYSTTNNSFTAEGFSVFVHQGVTGIKQDEFMAYIRRAKWQVDWIVMDMKF